MNYNNEFDNSYANPKYQKYEAKQKKLNSYKKYSNYYNSKFQAYDQNGNLIPKPTEEQQELEQNPSFKLYMKILFKRTKHETKKFNSQYKEDKQDIKYQMSKAGVHNFHDFLIFLGKLYKEFPQKAQKLIKDGLIASIAIIVLFLLIGIFAGSISDVFVGILLGLIGSIVTDVIAIKTYPITSKTFRN